MIQQRKNQYFGHGRKITISIAVSQDVVFTIEGNEELTEQYRNRSQLFTDLIKLGLAKKLENMAREQDAKAQQEAKNATKHVHP